MNIYVYIYSILWEEWNRDRQVKSKKKGVVERKREKERERERKIEREREYNTPAQGGKHIGQYITAIIRPGKHL